MYTSSAIAGDVFFYCVRIKEIESKENDNEESSDSV